MTKDEFAAKLTKDTGVDFDGSKISVPSEPIAKYIAKTLKLLLPDGEVIAHGVQIGELKGGHDGWEGKLIWLFSLRLHLLVLTADVRYEGVGNQKKSRLHIEHQFYRKERVMPNLRIRWGHVLEHAHLTLHCDGSLIEVFSESWLSPDALCRFVATILPGKEEDG